MYLTQMPVPGLDDITPESIARELRGLVYQVREAMDRALDTGDAGGYRSARARLIELTHRAAEEGIEL
jgi:hypothetical protein